ncbi:NAD(P)/FAD-dependent oxidoreductase [Acidocella facilis]|uniref:NAD(P)/FAD-dependent oxidoreductase n=1 Tax=Acidocella facilis TaxID=525 RepID=UPI001F2AF8D3|nr:FAD-dependent oxidoreductase [Acidocella facilis]
MDEDWRKISLWWDGLYEPLTPRPALAGDIVADIAIIGAGYTGLWTAYYLKTRAPHLNIAVLEARRAGFGASGRNGGWVMGAVLGENRLVGHLPEPQRRESWALLHAIPDEVGRVTAREEIGCDFRKGGTLYCAARYPEQEARLRGWLHELYAEGYQESDAWWLPPEELSQQLRLHGALGALYTPHCATIQPAKLARGLAVAVERLGVRIYEHTPATGWAPGQVRTAQGKVSADWVIPAVEGYAATLPPLGAYQLPVQSLLIATEPLPASVWAGIGLSRGQSFSEFSRQVTYGQRTADDRLVFGARGGYRFGGRLRTDFTLTDAEEGLRRHLLTDLFPQLRDAKITHRWGGNLGMSRRFQPHMLLDRRNRIALSGGYGGEGVGAANLGGRTLADLILGQETPETRQPWVIQDRALRQALRSWEPEPLRWLGYNAIIASFTHEDQVLANPASPPWRRQLAQALATRMEGLMR